MAEYAARVKTRISSGTVLLGLVLCLAACGGGATSSAVSAPSTFVADANHVCAVYDAKAQALPAPTGLKQLDAYPRRQQTIREQELSALRMLRPPAAQRHAYTRFLARVATVNELYAKAIAGSGGGRVSTVRALVERASKLEGELRGQAQAMALTKCARNPYSAIHRVSSHGSSSP